MSRWAGLDAEIAGVVSAERNLKDHGKLARYVYGRACAYVGADHEGITVRLIIAALEATAPTNRRAAEPQSGLAHRIIKEWETGFLAIPEERYDPGAAEQYAQEFVKWARMEVEGICDEDFAEPAIQDDSHEGTLGRSAEPSEHKWNCPSHPLNVPCHCGATPEPTEGET